MADPVTNAPEESRVDAVTPSRSALELLRRPDFRRVYVAVSASELGDALQYIALMWFAFEAGGPLGVLAVRLADSVPALVFGLHGGLVADRWDRKRVLIATDLIRAAVLIPVAIAGLAGELPLWGLVVAAFLLTSATSYFDPADGSLLPRSSTVRTSSRRTGSSARPPRRCRSGAGRSRPGSSPSSQ